MPLGHRVRRSMISVVTTFECPYPHTPLNTPLGKPPFILLLSCLNPTNNCVWEVLPFDVFSKSHSYLNLCFVCSGYCKILEAQVGGGRQKEKKRKRARQQNSLYKAVLSTLYFSSLICKMQMTLYPQRMFPLVVKPRLTDCYEHLPHKDTLKHLEQCLICRKQLPKCQLLLLVAITASTKQAK